MTAAIAQQGRFVFPGDDPLGDRARYVVTVTNRSRDLAALARLAPAVAERVTPSIRLVHLGGPVERVTQRRVRDWAAGIRAGVTGPGHWFELTGFDPLQPTAGPARSRRRPARRPPPGRPLLLTLTGELGRQGRRSTPVIRVGPMSERLRSLVVTVGHGGASGLGLAVALGSEPGAGGRGGGDGLADLRAVVERLRLDPGQVDVLAEVPVDRGQRLTPAELAGVVERIRALAPWRNLVLVGSGVPSIIPRPEPGGTGLIVVERPDWPDHQELVRLLDADSRAGVRADAGTGADAAAADAGAGAGAGADGSGDGGAVTRPTFGDYGLRHPLRLAWPGTKRANLRYTAGEVSLVAMGEATRNGLAPGAEFGRLCRAVAAHPRFRGPEHCWGCHRIATAASGPDDEVPGLQSAWDTAGLVHHITEVVDQLG